MRDSNRVLDTSENMPSFELNLVEIGKIRIPEDLGSGFSVVFFYRGYW